MSRQSEGTSEVKTADWPKADWPNGNVTVAQRSALRHAKFEELFEVMKRLQITRAIAEERTTVAMPSDEVNKRKWFEEVWFDFEAQDSAALVLATIREEKRAETSVASGRRVRRPKAKVSSSETEIPEVSGTSVRTSAHSEKGSDQRTVAASDLGAMTAAIQAQSAQLTTLVSLLQPLVIALTNTSGSVEQRSAAAIGQLAKSETETVKLDESSEDSGDEMDAVAAMLKEQRREREMNVFSQTFDGSVDRLIPWIRAIERHARLDKWSSRDIWNLVSRKLLTGIALREFEAVADELNTWPSLRRWLLANFFKEKAIGQTMKKLALFSRKTGADLEDTVRCFKRIHAQLVSEVKFATTEVASFSATTYTLADEMLRDRLLLSLTPKEREKALKNGTPEKLSDLYSVLAKQIAKSECCSAAMHAWSARIGAMHGTDDGRANDSGVDTLRRLKLDSEGLPRTDPYRTGPKSTTWKSQRRRVGRERRQPETAAKSSGISEVKSSGVCERCFRCGSRDHVTYECLHEDVVCFNCGEEGHIADDCTEKRKKKWMPPKPPEKKPVETQTVESEAIRVIREKDAAAERLFRATEPETEEVDYSAVAHAPDCDSFALTRIEAAARGEDYDIKDLFMAPVF